MPELTSEQQERLDRLVTLVTLRVDEYTEGVDEGQIPDVPTGDIKYELRQAARSLLRKLARHAAFLPSTTLDTQQANLVQRDDSTVVHLPEDYLRFVSLKMEGWKRAATRWVSDNSQVARQQIYPMRRGTAEKPVCVLIPVEKTEQNPKGMAIEAWPKGETLEELHYVPYQEAYDLDEDYEDALVWLAVVSVLIIMRQEGVTKMALGKADAALAELNLGEFGEGG